MASKTTTGKSITKSETYQKLGEATGLSRKQVAAVFDSLTKIIEHNLGKKGPGVFALPGLAKLKVLQAPVSAAQDPCRPSRCAALSSFWRVRNNITLIVFWFNPVMTANSTSEWPSTSLSSIKVRACSGTLLSNLTTI